jgi:hypothetical protein
MAAYKWDTLPNYALHQSIMNSQNSYCKWSDLRFNEGTPAVLLHTSHVWHRQSFSMTEDAMRSDSTQRSTDRSAEQAPTSTCLCGECRSRGQYWTRDRQILPMYMTDCVTEVCRTGRYPPYVQIWGQRGPQKSKIPLTCTRLRTADLQAGMALHICSSVKWKSAEQRVTFHVCSSGDCSALYAWTEKYKSTMNTMLLSHLPHVSFQKLINSFRLNSVLRVTLQCSVKAQKKIM